MLVRESLAACFVNLIIKEKTNDYKTMKDDVIKECTMYYKTSEIGESEVCEAMREYVAKYAEKSFNSGMAKGEAKGTAKTLLDLVNKGTITLNYAIENSGLPKEEFLSIAKSLGYNL